MGSWAYFNSSISFWKTVTEKLEKLNKIKADIEAGTLALNDKIDEDVIQSFDAKGITPDGIIPDFVYSPEIAKAVFSTELNKVGIINPNKATIVIFQKLKKWKQRMLILINQKSK